MSFTDLNLRSSDQFSDISIDSRSSKSETASAEPEKTPGCLGRFFALFSFSPKQTSQQQKAEKSSWTASISNFFSRLFGSKSESENVSSSSSTTSPLREVTATFSNGGENSPKINYLLGFTDTPQNNQNSTTPVLERKRIDNSTQSTSVISDRNKKELDKPLNIQHDVSSVQNDLQDTTNVLVQRGEKLQSALEGSEKLLNGANDFSKLAKQLQRQEFEQIANSWGLFYTKKQIEEAKINLRRMDEGLKPLP